MACKGNEMTRSGPMKYLKVLFPYLFFGAMVTVVVVCNIKYNMTPPPKLEEGEKAIDPVCRMPVNVKWNVNQNTRDQPTIFVRGGARHSLPMIPMNTLASGVWYAMTRWIWKLP